MQLGRSDPRMPEEMYGADEIEPDYEPGNEPDTELARFPDHDPGNPQEMPYIDVDELYSDADGAWADQDEELAAACDDAAMTA